MNDNENTHKKSIFERKEEDMTHGVEINIWKDTQNKIFSLWDFAGNNKNFELNNNINI